MQRAAAPRLPLSFPSLAHEINFLCVMALLDTPAYAAQYAAKSSATDDAWSDVVLRGCMAAYISSTTDEFSSRANLLGAKGMKWPAKKLAELFNLSLSEMHETDHPTMPAVKVGERREGRHAAVVRAMAECLSAASRRLEQAGYESAGEVVLRGFEAAREQGEVGGASVVAQLLDVLPELGEAYEIGGISECCGTTSARPHAKVPTLYSHLPAFAPHPPQQQHPSPPPAIERRSSRGSSAGLASDDRSRGCAQGVPDRLGGRHSELGQACPGHRFRHWILSRHG